jgi:hypothetical protein
MKYTFIYLKNNDIEFSITFLFPFQQNELTYFCMLKVHKLLTKPENRNLTGNLL